MASIKKLAGIPRQSEEEQKQAEVVKTPEFDLTVFAKGLVPAVIIVFTAIIAALKKAGVEEVTEPTVLLGVLAVVTAAVLGMSFVSAIDIAARAFLSGEGSAQKKPEGDGKPTAETRLVAMPSGTLVWLQGDDRALPLLAVSDNGADAGSYLVASGETVEAGRSAEGQKAIKGAPKWEPADKIVAVRPPKWKP